MDILYTDTDEAVIRNGDFEGAENTDFQHQRHIIIGEMGEFRNAPLMGVGLRRQEKSSGNQDFIKKRIKLQLEIDGYRVDKLIIDSDNVEINSERI